jgi:acetolactate synthase-1/2/3 large subunit
MLVANYTIDRLAQLQIREFFFLPLGSAVHLNDALGVHPQLKPIACLHEQVFGIAAYAARKLISFSSACLVISGQGASNVMTADMGERLDSKPCVTPLMWLLVTQAILQKMHI